MALYKGLPLKCGTTLNGKDLLEYDPIEIKNFLNSLPKKESELLKTIIKNNAGWNDIPEDYAKDYGRPSLSEKPYMTCENDGMPYLGGGHSPVCDGKMTYKSDIYQREPDMCFL